ncbi:esterase/lipase family protein [Tomitella gaofuii]|uniref:esterase/lipase family protein n=1 Tax=Tomitella gaofuii TaxID=2760083 RepID=UPI0015FBFA44|nr:alpha/beta fold hydrolase [Tomitella gaofuii]
MARRHGDRTVGRGVVAVAAVLAVFGAAPATASAASPWDRITTLTDTFMPVLRNPGGSLPGVNDWGCTPGAEHPEPVILVHGTFSDQQINWGAMAPRLKDAGYCVYALDYGVNPGTPWPLSAFGGLTRMQDSAQELSVFVDKVLAASGAQKVDFVGHSQGTLMPNYYVKFLGGAPTVDEYVSLAPLWNGTDAVGPLTAGAGTAAQGDPVTDAMTALMDEYCGACAQMTAGSPFIEKMNAGGTYAPGVEYTNIMTRYDGTVVPWSSGYVEGQNATNIVVQDGCPQDHSDHSSLVASVRAQAMVLNALDPADPVPVPCVAVQPFSG